MAVVNTYKVVYHFEQGGKKSGPDYIDHVQASAVSGISGVLSSNTKLKPGTLVIDSVQEVGYGDTSIA